MNNYLLSSTSIKSTRRCTSLSVLFCSFYIRRRLILNRWGVDIGHSDYCWICACTTCIWTCWQILNVVERLLRRFFLLLPYVLIDSDCGLLVKVIFGALIKVRFCKVLICRKQRDRFFAEHCLKRVQFFNWIHRFLHLRRNSRSLHRQLPRLLLRPSCIAHIRSTVLIYWL